MSTAENDLRCNNFKCRVYVATEGKAVVTTCSHVFCLNCVNHLFSPNPADRICPACDEGLPEEDDVVVSCLNPSNDYKSSILAGLAPGVILDIASRVLVVPELTRDSMSLKNSKEQIARLEQELTIVRGELHNTQKRNRELEDQLHTATRTTQNAIQDARDKDKDMTKLRAHYDKIKRKNLLGAAAQTAEDDARPLSAIPGNLRAPPGTHQRVRAPVGTPNNRPHPYQPTQVTGGYGGVSGLSTPGSQVGSGSKRFHGLSTASKMPGLGGHGVARYGGPSF